jgi:hypothetical protein
MMMTYVQNLQELRASDAFATDANLDLSQFPWLEDKPEVADEEQMVSEARGNLLQNIAKMIEEDGGDRDIAKALADGGLENPSVGATVHVVGKPFSINFRSGSWHGEGVLDNKRRRLTASSRDALINKFMELAKETRRETLHQLTQSERLQIVRVAQSGDVRGAIANYLRLSIGEDRASRYENPSDMLGDESLAETFDDAAALTWFAARPKVQDSEDFQDFLEDYRSGRPLNHDLLDGAWSAFTDSRNRIVFADPQKTRGAAKQSDEPFTGLEQLDALNDDEVDTLFAATKRAAVAGRR